MAKKEQEISERMDYDNLFKTVLHRFFWDALKMFLPSLYEAADREVAPDFLEEEFRKVMLDLDEGANRSDILARITLKDGSKELILCHVEIQGSGGGDMPTRMYRYKQMIYLKHGQEPVGIAVATAPRPHDEKAFYRWERFGVKVAYDYINVDVMGLEDDMLLAKDNRLGLILYAAKYAYQSGDNEGEKFRYLRLLSNMWAECGWDKEDKRIILLAIDYLINLKDEQYVKEMLAHVDSLKLKMKEEDREMYVSMFERGYKAIGKEEGRIEGRIEGRNEGRIEGRNEGRIEGRNEGRNEGRMEGCMDVAESMLRDGFPVEKVIQYTKLPRENIETLLQN